MRPVIPIVLLLLAAWFVARERPVWPVPPRADLGPLAVDATPLRPRDPRPGMLDVGGVELRCSDCHALFDSEAIQPRPLAQHTDVKLDHGLNDNCLNCHAGEDRNRYALYNGRLAGPSEVDQLCAKCHGTTWRDWQQGTHGRTNGSWDAASGEQRRLTCIECHDPHAPALGRLPTFPGPNTLRMGDVRKQPHVSGAGRGNPLQAWRENLGARGSSAGQLPDEAEDEQHRDG